MATIIKLKKTPRCSRCGGSILTGYEEPACIWCGQPYTEEEWRSKNGRLGGLQTLKRYGREHMIEMGKKGGRPRIHQRRQQSVPQVQFLTEGGRLPNRLGELKELYRLRNKNGGSKSTSDCSPPGGVDSA